MKQIFLYLIILSLILAVACVHDECMGNDGCYFDKAILLNDSYYCLNIKNAQIRRSCLSEIAIKKQDIEQCNLINSSYCISCIAENKVEPAICKTIDDVHWHDTCLKNIAFGSSNNDFCKEIISDDVRDECNEGIAKKLNESKLCYFIVNSDKRDLCIYKLATTLGNSNDCYEIRDALIKSNCYFKIAVLTGKENICDNIQIGLIRDDCKEQLSKQTISLNLSSA